MSDYRESHLALDKGEAYDRRFVDTPHRAMMWELERAILDEVVGTMFPDRSANHLDFACGTGRILRHLARFARRSVGVDVSPSMLAVARRAVEGAELLEVDLTRTDILGERTFNLITAFRFFPNAQPRLRDEVMDILVRHLAPGGYLIFNNHLNSSSAFIKLAHLAGKARTLGMSHGEVESMLGRARLEVVGIRHIGVLPSNDRYMFLPKAIVRAVEEWAAQQQMFRRVSQNLIYVCRRV